MKVAAAILAAGRGSRFEGASPKPLVELHGRTLVAHALDAASDAGLSPIVLVVGHRRRRVARAAPAGTVVVRNRDWREGIASSLRAALDALDAEDVDAVCIGLADQPGIGAEAYRRLVTAAERGAVLAVATYAGERGNPVLLGRDLWEEAGALTGDVGARALMGSHDVVEVDCTGTGDPRDVDTLADLRALHTKHDEAP